MYPDNLKQELPLLPALFCGAGAAKRYEAHVDKYLAEREAGQVQGTLF